MTRFPYPQHLMTRLALAALLLTALLVGLHPPPAQAASIIVTTANDSIDNNDGYCSLREAIINANNDDQSGSTECVAGDGADAITFAGNYIITLNSQLPAVTTEITITGNGVTNTIVQASTCNPVTESCSHNYRVFAITGSGNLTLAGLTVRHGRVGNYNYGGGIYNAGGAVTLNDSTLSGNSAYHGGGIENRQGTVTVSNSTLSGNSADGEGGGIYNWDGGTATVNNSTLSGNSATISGGGIYNWDGGTVTVNNSTLSNNSADSGGGISNDNSTVTVNNSTLSGNSATIFGGGIYNWDGGTVTVSNSTLSGNSADYHGGGIQNDSTVTVRNSTLSGNSADYGGGIENGGTVTVRNSTLSGNSADYGGGIENSGTVMVSNSTLSGNSAGLGGGIENWYGGTVTVRNSTLSGNSGALGGGILNWIGGAVTIGNSTLSGNSAIDGGGIANRDGGTVTVNNSTLTANRVDTSGGGISSWGNDSTVTAITSTIVSGNIISGTVTFADLALSSGGPITDSFTSGGHNLIGAIGLNISAFQDGGNGDQTAVNNPQLGPLTDNGGDTLTHALLPGSSAIDAGDNNACPATDQRGVVRPQGGGCDIGAVELDVVDPTVVVEQASGQADPTNASPINFTVTFNEPINTTTFTATDVTLGGTAPGTLSALITQIAPDDTTTFNIAVNGMTGSGTVTAAIVADTVEDIAGNSNSASTSTDNSVTYDPTAPTVVSSLRADTSPTIAASVDFTVTFSEAVTGVGIGDFDLVTSGVSGAAVTGVSGSGSVYTVTVSTGSGSGSIQLTIPASATITDSFGNALSSAFTSGETYEIDMSVYLPLVLNNFVSANEVLVKR